MANVAKRPDGRWRARYRDDAGKEHARHFDRKVDAQRWLDEVTAAVVTGRYVDPRAGGVSFGAYYDKWSARQVWESTTVLAMSLAVRSTTFRDVDMGKLRRSHVEAWVKGMVTAGLAPGTIKTRVNNVRAVLRAAVRDRIIASDPSEGVTLPGVAEPKSEWPFPPSSRSGRSSTPQTIRSDPSSRSLPSQACGSARSPGYRSATSTS